MSFTVTSPPPPSPRAPTKNVVRYAPETGRSIFAKRINGRSSVTRARDIVLAGLSFALVVAVVCGVPF